MVHHLYELDDHYGHGTRFVLKVVVITQPLALLQD
jgi:hypothetical protein